MNGEIREITVYSCGDSRKASTWSNVPYKFCEALERHGIRVNRVNIEPHRTLNRLFNTLSFKIWRRLLRHRACPVFMRTILHRAIIHRRLRTAARRFPDSDLNLFLSYEFVNPYSNAPNVQWCDWSDKIVIERLGRSPQWYERGALRAEEKAMKQADAVYSMFPECGRRMSHDIGRQVIWLGRNVINSFSGMEYDAESVSRRHYASKRILFVGNHLYRSGALSLIEAVGTLKRKYPELEVDVVGMTDDILGVSRPWVKVHGYLRKDIAEQRELYYDLMRGARVFVNPTQGWGGYSSTIEAMYYGCPIVVAPYSDFVAEMGSEIPFGCYTNGDDLIEQLQTVIKATEIEYYKMSEAAHNRVADYTWDNYVEAFLESLRKN